MPLASRGDRSWRNDDIGSRIPAVPPFLAIEILSPEERMVRMLPRIHEYLSPGVEFVWVVDPQERAAICFSQKNRQGTVYAVLRTPDIEIPREKVFGLDA
jgi:Uma2 family endonuclease